MPIFKIDNVLINQGKIGEVTKKIKETYQRIVRAKESKLFKLVDFC